MGTADVSMKIGEFTNMGPNRSISSLQVLIYEKLQSGVGIMMMMMMMMTFFPGALLDSKCALGLTETRGISEHHGQRRKEKRKGKNCMGHVR